jgi:hypothetical protein
LEILCRKHSGPDGQASVVTLPVSGLLPHTNYTVQTRATAQQGTILGGPISFSTSNRTPVTTNDRLHPTATQFSVDVLSNDNDADGDQLTIASVGPSKLEAGTVTVSGTSLNYVGNENFAGNDSLITLIPTVVAAQPQDSHSRQHTPRSIEHLATLLGRTRWHDAD